MQTKNCQNCKKNFTIESEDFEFYKKMQVPPPTLCFRCRLIRKMCWRNERIWYRRTCEATGKNVLSIFDPKGPYKVYDQEYWRSDAWDPLEYGREYNFSRGFFEQFSDLLKAVPQPNLFQKNIVRSEYSNNSLNLKNCYIAIATDGAEDCAYVSGLIRRLKDCLDMYHSSDDEYCYECADCEQCSRLFFSENCVSCLDSYFLYDCRNCTNCVGCVGLRNAQYYIFNEQYTKDEYKDELQKLNLGSHRSRLELHKKFEALKLAVPRKYASILNATNVVGDDIMDSRNCYWCFNAKDNVEDCKFSFRINQNVKDGYDGYIVWNGSELFYETLSSTGRNFKFSGMIWGGYDVEYSYNCFDCNNIFGCTGLRNKSYCIFNRQYPKDEYEKLVVKIRELMTVKGEYGEFFPAEISPFTYNETSAQEYFPKTKAEALALGYFWKDTEEKSYAITVSNADIPDNIKDITDSALKEVFECAHKGKCADHCSTAFRIIPMELSFLRRFNIPLPRLCFGCRHMERIRQKPPLNLWHRSCLCKQDGHGHGPVCPNEFETSYAPDRPEMVYCESCYQKEIL